jgi:AraC-like DNA-binding protein
MPVKSTNSADYQDTPRPVAAMAKDFPDGAEVGSHAHSRCQLIWAVTGVMRVTSAEAAWIVPPNRALWMPAGAEHAIRRCGRVAMRTLYIDPAAVAGLGAKVVAVPRLLRELILEAVRAPLDYNEHGRMGHVAALILDELRALEAQPLRLPLPRDPRLRRLCEALLREPGRGETLDEWGERVGASGRTLARLFSAETGMRFTDWRSQARLAHAMARLAKGEALGAIAAGLGYKSSSAFIALFRRTLGATPRQFLTGR